MYSSQQMRASTARAQHTQRRVCLSRNTRKASVNPAVAVLSSKFNVSLSTGHQQRHTSSQQRHGVVTSATSGSVAFPMSDSSGNSRLSAWVHAISTATADVIAHIRGVLFAVAAFVLGVPMLISMLLLTPFMHAMDRHRKCAIHSVSNIWAKASSLLFFQVEIQGRENLPPSTTAAVYVANHQSFLDIFSLFFLDRPFKFISKASIFFIPIIGWCMFLVGHVMLKRMERRSQLACLQQCGQLLKNGASVFFFPEGTRSTNLKLQEFKKGAFSVAVKAGAPVVPITIIGTGSMMPSGKESMLRPGRVTIIIHKLIDCKGRTADEVCSEARQAVANGMPPQLLA